MDVALIENVFLDPFLFWNQNLDKLNFGVQPGHKGFMFYA